MGYLKVICALQCVIFQAGNLELAHCNSREKADGCSLLQGSLVASHKCKLVNEVWWKKALHQQAEENRSLRNPKTQT